MTGFGTLDEGFKQLTTQVGGTYDRATHSSEAIGDAVASILGSTGPALRLIYQALGVGSAERGVRKALSINLLDRVTGALADGDIDIISISVDFEKDDGSGFSAAGITQPTFSKSVGSVRSDVLFLNAEWAVGDSFKVEVVGITATVDGTSGIPVPRIVWTGSVVEAGDHEVVLGGLVTDSGVAFTSVDGKQDTAQTDLDELTDRPVSLNTATRAAADIGAGEVEITNTTQHTSARGERVVLRVRGTGLVAAAATYTIRAETTRGATLFEKVNGSISKSSGPTNFETDADPFTLESGDVTRVFIQSSDAGDAAVGIEAEFDEVG